MNFISALAPSFEAVDNYGAPAARSTMRMNDLLKIGLKPGRMVMCSQHETATGV
ncbi:MAG: hypothetical protein J6J99_08905 [Oscillibacter sp.]|nr:hypothetical protein [Oscillibacter sp.]